MTETCEYFAMWNRPVTKTNISWFHLVLKSTQIQRKVVVKGYIHHTNTIKCTFNHVQLTYPVVQGKLLKHMILTKIYKRQGNRGNVLKSRILIIPIIRNVYFLTSSKGKGKTSRLLLSQSKRRSEIRVKKKKKKAFYAYKFGQDYNPKFRNS